MIELVRSLKVVIPTITGQLIPSDLPIINANPQCGPLPLTSVRGLWEEDHCVLEGRISDKFVRAQVLPRGRPHFSLIHVALVDDNIATLCYALYTGEEYGRVYRYIESGVGVNFHREAFVRGTLVNIPKGSVDVDYYLVSWELLKHGSKPIDKQGVFRVAVYGYRDSDRIHVVSWEGEYFRRRGVLNIFRQ